MEARINSTEQECRTILRTCRELFAKKLHDYGAAWRILRPESLTDQIYIKAERIRGIQMRGMLPSTKASSLSSSASSTTGSSA